MKKQLIVALVTGAAVLTYFILKRKYAKVDNEVIDLQSAPLPVSKKHHLTKAFSNAKKHALHIADNT